MAGTQRLPDDTGIINRVRDACPVEFVRLDSLPDPETILSAGELEKYDSFKFKKRKREWLGGRTAAKKLVLEAGPHGPPQGAGRGTDPRDIVISYDKYGRPVCSSIPISISHCSDYAVAAMGRTASAIGVDLEKIQKRSYGWIEESFHDCELYPEADRNPEKTTALWTQAPE